MHNIAEKLSALIDPTRIITKQQDLAELAWDALSVGRIHPERQPAPAAPLCAVMPLTTAEVRSTVLFANSEKIPIIPFGGGSGLMGGALSVRPGLVLDLRFMNQIIEIDAASRAAQAQAGIILETLDQKLNAVGLILGHDPWTVPVATVGGAISTHSVGYRAGIYGSMGDQVLGLEAVLPNGEIIRTRGVSKSSTGINLNSLFIGGEGCFGIITEATIRVFPTPQCRLFHSMRFVSFEQGYGAIQDLFKQGLKPAVVDFGDAPDSDGAGAVLFLAFEGKQEIVEVEMQSALAVCRQHGAAQLPQEKAEQFWENRHVIARRFAQNRRQRRERGLDGFYRDWIHVALPASRVLSFRRAAMEIINQHGVRLQESGLWVHPELFSMRLGASASDTPNAQLALEQTVEELLQLVQRMGGAMEYTHGVGVKLASFMPGEHGYGLEVMRQIKQSLDPNNIMNPGKMGL